MHCSVIDPIPKRLIPVSFLLSITLCLSGLAAEGSNGVSSKIHATKTPFSFSTADISDNLVTVSCKNKSGHHTSNGYIARMDGKTYLLTRQHTLFGAEKILCKTLSGTTLRPLGIELSASRDIARLLLDVEAAGFEISDEVAMNTSICIPENSTTAGTVNKLTGKIIGIGPETVEVSTPFSPENGGAPVLNPDLTVLGISSYVTEPYQDAIKRGTQFEFEPRYFCYRIANTDWKPVNWRVYNSKCGNFFHENMVFTEQVSKIALQLNSAPMKKINTKKNQRHDLASWISLYNGTLSGRRKSDQNKQAFAGEYVNCIKKLSSLCRMRAQKTQAFLEKHELTPFLRKELQLQAETQYSIVELLNYISTYGKDYR